jgi:RNA polymerase sigma-70 factor (ECF subfamily)
LSDERDLVRRCLAREERAYRELIRRYQTPVVNLAWRITGNPEDAAEVAQETFIRVLRSLHTYDPERPLKTWLFKIAANLALDSIRRRKRRPVAMQDLFDEDEGPVPEAVESGPGPQQDLEVRQSLERFDELVTEMPEHYQTILFLRYREDLAYEEIAETLGMPLGTVKVRLFRAHEILRRKLTARGARGTKS